MNDGCDDYRQILCTCGGDGDHDRQNDPACASCSLLNKIGKGWSVLVHDALIWKSAHGC